MSDHVYYTDCRWCETTPQWGDVDAACNAQNKKGMTCTREAGHEGKHVACTGEIHEAEKW